MITECELKQALFDAASELDDPAQRQVFLEAACHGDTLLLAKMKKLLQAGERAEEFFAGCTPTPDTISAALDVGEVIAAARPRPAPLGGPASYGFQVSRQGSCK